MIIFPFLIIIRHMRGSKQRYVFTIKYFIEIYVLGVLTKPVLLLKLLVIWCVFVSIYVGNYFSVILMQRLFYLFLNKYVYKHSEIFCISAKQVIPWRKWLIRMKILCRHLLLIHNDKVIRSLTQLTIIFILIIRIIIFFLVIVLHHIGDNFEHLKVIWLAWLDNLQSALLFERLSV